MKTFGHRALLAVVAVLAAGCGGGSPLLHPAHVLAPGVVSVGAGVSAEAAVLRKNAAGGDQAAGVLQSSTVSGGVSPWVGARVGVEGSNEGGLTYAGRSVRLDGRHAFSLGVPTLSIGLGASVVLPGHSSSDVTSAVYGGGLDLPILIGVHSRSDLYALWIGPRAGLELLRGNVPYSAVTAPSPLFTPDEGANDTISATHFHAGGVAGLRAGFRHVHVALEVDAEYHYATASFGQSAVLGGAIPSASIRVFSITPAGALILTF